MAVKKPSVWGTLGSSIGAFAPGAVASTSPFAADYALTAGTLEGLPFAAPASVGGAGLTGGALSSGLGMAGIGAGAATGYLQAQGAMNAIKGDKLSLLEETALALPTFGTSFLFDKFGSSKDKDQQLRDKWRAAEQQAGTMDEAWNVTNADGSKFDMGKDGKTKNYNVDWSKEGAGNYVGLIDPLADIKSGGSDKLRSDIAGQFYNAATSSGNVEDNIRKYYADAGLDHEKAYAAIKSKYEGKTDEASIGRRDAELASLDRLFGGQAKQASSGGGSGGGGGSSRPNVTVVVKPEDTTFLPNIGVTPQQSTPAPVVEPDDEPTPEEQSSVDSYSALLKKKVKQTQG